MDNVSRHGRCLSKAPAEEEMQLSVEGDLLSLTIPTVSGCVRLVDGPLGGKADQAN